MALKDFKFESGYFIEDWKTSSFAINTFLIPALQNSTEYKRCAGYFRSSFFRLCFIGMRDFFNAGGKIKMLCNEHLLTDDKDAMVDGLTSNLSEDIDKLLKDYKTKDRFKLLASLISTKKLEIRICVTKNSKDPLPILHNKTGIFKDNQDTVTFTGSINETYLGWRKNVEGITLESSHGDGREKNIKLTEDFFDRMWEVGKTGDWVTMKIPEAIIEGRIKEHSCYDEAGIDLELEKQEEIEKKIREERNKNNNLDEDEEKQIYQNYMSNEAQNNKTYKEPIKLRQHQTKAIEAWRDNNFRAIIKYCTGSGKTHIALDAINQMLDLGKKPIVLVPSLPLVYQWEERLEKYVNAETLSCHSKAKVDYKKFLKTCSSDNKKRVVIISTIHTAVTKKFKNLFLSGNHNFLIVDECHTLWAARYNKILSDFNWKDCPRLALSATPEDTSFSDDIAEDESEDLELYREEESSIVRRGDINIFEFFGGNLDNTGVYGPNKTYNLSDAIREKNLMQYEYFISTVYLNEDETDAFIKLSVEIKNLAAVTNSRSSKEQKDALKSKCNRRARIIKIANNKKQKCIDILEMEKGENNKTLEEDHWLIYVGPGVTDGQSEIEHVRSALNNEFKNINVYPYYSQITHRETMIKNFEAGGGICLACAMLDEGIDIPQLSKAIVMASSKNERQFVQRRGRVLRIDDRVIRGKRNIVKIWDIFTLPHPNVSHDDLRFYEQHIHDECNRAEIFARDSVNEDLVLSQINRIRSRIEATL